MSATILKRFNYLVTGSPFPRLTQWSTVMLIQLFSLSVTAQPLPPYQNAALSIPIRVKDLIGRMTREEKTGQLSILLGWDMYTRNGDQVTVSEKFKTAISTANTGMLWATLRADPWTQKTLNTGLNPGLAAAATNALQQYAISHSRLGIPLLLAEECPHGHMAIGTTVFPTSIGQGSTWNPALIQEMAAVIALEARLQGAHIGYGPVLDLAREPRWSRVEETYGEDPVLTSRMGEAMVKGFQGERLNSGINLISTLKHFTAYGAPEGGHNGGSVAIGKRELLQSYLPPFKAAVRAGALSVMTAYNSIDGIPCSANHELLTEILKEQWGFRGFVVSDLNSISGLINNHQVAGSPEDAAALAMNAGLDADLSGYGYGEALLKALAEGKVTDQQLDQAVARVLTLKFEMGLFEQPYVDIKKAVRTVRKPAHIALARKVARESIILLRNQKNLLPLPQKYKKIAVIGPNADQLYNQLGDYTAPQEPGAVVTVLQGIRARAAAGVTVNYSKGVAIRDTSSQEIAAAVALAKTSDIAVVVLGGSSARDFKTTYLQTGAATIQKALKEIPDMESGEGFDRATLTLLGKQMELLRQIVSTGKPVVLVLIKGRPLNLNWAAENVDAILDAWYPGQEGGNAIADVLFGDYNPSGRLPVSVPKSVGQLPVYYNFKKPAPHSYVEMDEYPLYSFGYGLSYTTFHYDQLQTTVTGVPGQQRIKIRFLLKNTGAVAGTEVVQLYVKDQVSSVVSPVIQLKNFQKIKLKPGETRQVSFELVEEDLKLYNKDLQWVLEPGVFNLMIGASATDIRLKQDITIL